MWAKLELLPSLDELVARDAQVVDLDPRLRTTIDRLADLGVLREGHIIDATEALKTHFPESMIQLYVLHVLRTFLSRHEVISAFWLATTLWSLVVYRLDGHVNA